MTKEFDRSDKDFLVFQDIRELLYILVFAESLKNYDVERKRKDFIDRRMIEPRDR